MRTRSLQPGIFTATERRRYNFSRRSNRDSVVCAISGHSRRVSARNAYGRGVVVFVEFSDDFARIDLQHQLRQLREVGLNGGRKSSALGRLRGERPEGRRSENRSSGRNITSVAKDGVLGEECLDRDILVRRRSIKIGGRVAHIGNGPRVLDPVGRDELGAQRRNDQVRQLEWLGRRRNLGADAGAEAQGQSDRQ